MYNRVKQKSCKTFGQSNVMPSDFVETHFYQLIIITCHKCDKHLNIFPANLQLQPSSNFFFRHSALKIFHCGCLRSLCDACRCERSSLSSYKTRLYSHIRFSQPYSCTSLLPILLTMLLLNDEGNFGVVLPRILLLTSKKNCPRFSFRMTNPKRTECIKKS